MPKQLLIHQMQLKILLDLSCQALQNTYVLCLHEGMEIVLRIYSSKNAAVD